ncbi:MAG: Hydrolase, alpha/beta fold family, partial [uncultured Thermomicrobiales bacterium]
VPRPPRKPGDPARPVLRLSDQRRGLSRLARLLPRAATAPARGLGPERPHLRPGRRPCFCPRPPGRRDSPARHRPFRVGGPRSRDRRAHRPVLPRPGRPL